MPFDLGDDPARWRHRLWCANASDVIYAAIRALYDQQQGGVECLGCKGLFRTRRELSLLQADHIVAWSRGGQTIWLNLQILCRPNNLAKRDGSWESFGLTSKRSCI